MVYAEWQLLRQLQMAAAWTDEPAVELPQVPASWNAAAAGTAQPELAAQDPAEQLLAAQQESEPISPAQQLLQQLQQGAYQVQSAAFARRQPAVLTAGPDGASNPRTWAAPRWPESAEPWPEQPTALTRRSAGSMQAVSRYFERDARRYG